jgi:hypothetical protein
LSEWLIVEDVFEPEYLKAITLTVQNPARIFKEIKNMLVEVFRRTGPDFYEDVIKWDVSSDPVDFYGSWRIRDQKDARTVMWGLVIVQGQQYQKDKSGKITIWLRGTLRTKIPYVTPIEKSIAWLYMRLFYAERRRRYLIKAKEHFDKLENELRAMYGITQKVPKIEQVK